MTDDIPKPLATLTFLMTRPAQQVHPLCTNIEALGGNCIIFPTLEISPLPGLQPLLTPILNNLAQVDKVIFLSANAVRCVMPYWPGNGKIPPVFAIGPGTAKMLAAYRINSYTPQAEAFNSEGLLSLPELQAVTREKIVIFSGLDGRMLLANTLKTRGAQVTQVAVYQRSLPSVDFQAHLSQWQLGTIACIISTSHEGLNNLWQIAGNQGHSWLRRQQLLVISRPMAELARKLGFLLTPLIAANASDSAILDTLLAVYHECR